ncbi:D-isomer specific 2-hydroxyacid dehydrogenase NAD-binding [Chthoniobacter flavus Ellin428]|uniref:D-isomer specific 2-hydroxyacid dehydrogenase NAD-binding n=1 Tax=Chthoniobacter flavus Ellin428 TaxID=497964 RepID=B4D3A7_9BACT|nr:2-hydroxyacid dehydrogenase [Chthoniobacter flavus]EDY19218.1 D-isomer specific 2-hydroxyacid dehydrogenase NAD-binding [Chthoniobacter flavus Ellin428]TCO88062.1 D-lactate dehydrogenase [Chthoniobacter flavus]
MNVAFFSTKKYDQASFLTVNEGRHHLRFLEPHLTAETAALAKDSDAVCVFVNDTVDAEVLEELARLGVRFIALRCAGFNNVDLAAAARLGIGVGRVPAYSPYAVAEHTVALMLTLNRQIHRAYNRIREGNFSLDGLLGFDFHGRTVGLIGSGKIGAITAKILLGLGCQVIAYDPFPNAECTALGVEFVELDHLFRTAHIISLHCPLTPENHHLISSDALSKMRDGVMIINTSRGALIDTLAVIEALKSGRVGYLGLDVYEEEGDLFFEDLSDQIIADDIFTRLLTFPNVLITGHQAFFTRNALDNIAATTIANLTEFETSGRCANTPPVK